MKISVNDQELFSLTETQKKVIANDINEDMLEDDLKRRLEYIIMHKYEQCFKRLKADWEPKLEENGITMMPVKPDDFAQLVFSQPNYESRKLRDDKSKIKLE